MDELAQGVWADPKTGLMWARINIGQEWQEGQCLGEGQSLTWEQADQACTDLKLAGYEDWRLPTRDELKTLLLEGKKGYCCPKNTLFRPSRYTPGVYWSASIYASYVNLAYIIGFYLGKIDYQGKGFCAFARAVRTFTPRDNENRSNKD